jgi:HNH endonuclease
MEEPDFEDVLDGVDFIDNNGCMIWGGNTNRRDKQGNRIGYGTITRTIDGKRKNFYVHRISAATHLGSIPDDMTVDHECRNTLCVNPEHLRVVTQRENNQVHHKTKCDEGHDLTLPNSTYKLIKGEDVTHRCKICWREYMNNRYRQKKVVD